VLFWKKENITPQLKKEDGRACTFQKEASSHDPLEIYLREIRKTQLLNHADETSWATIVWNNKHDKIKRLKKAIEILRSLEHHKPLNQLLVLNKKSIYGYINLKNALLTHKKLNKVKNTALKSTFHKR